MSYCNNCGNELKDGEIICPNCGNSIEFNGVAQSDVVEKKEESNEKKVTFVDVKNVVTNVANKVEQGAQKFVNVSSEMIQNQKEKNKENTFKEIKEVQNEEKITSSRSMYMSSTELWSWLKKNMKRFQFYTEEECELSQQDFIDLVSEKIKENKVPASIERKYIQWDRSKVNKDVYYIVPNSNLANPLTCLIQFNKVGNFSYVDEKTFITPPNLPIPPDDPVEITDKDREYTELYKTGFGAIGLSFLVNAFTNVLFRDEGSMAVLILVLFGIVMIIGGIQAAMKYNEKVAYNKRCAEQLKVWNKAWKDWNDSVFIHSFQEDTNGQLSRIYDSVFACIKQVCDEQFKKTSEKDIEETVNMNELEQMISRRKEEYK